MGGLGERSAVTGALAAEFLAYGDPSAAIAIMAPSGFALPLLEFGAPEQIQTWLPGLAEGAWPHLAAAWVEPSFDFTPTALKTVAAPDPGGYRLDGEKIFVPFADQADALLVYADLDGCAQGFVVPAGAAGLEIGASDRRLGLRALPTFGLRLNGVHVELSARLEGAQASLDRCLGATRTATAGVAIGLAQAAHDYALNYAKERQAFGKPIAQKQSIAFMLAEMAIEIEAIRLLTWEAAWQLDQSKPEAAHTAYLALTGAADMAMMVTDRAVQILGGHGYIREHPVERWMRDARSLANLVGLVMV